ncbi:MAG TPA: glycosyltransferase family 2 protein [Acidimicrobiales bacterium]|nr:glycosyltransferase family 2 protein [Acidimicrobiales bacterium]
MPGATASRAPEVEEEGPPGGLIGDLAPPATPGKQGDARIDDDAASAFDRSYGEPLLGPVVVLVPAYNEEGSIGEVLDAVPPTLADHHVSRLVVVDGSTDDTAAVADYHGAYVCVAATNRGQGAALRLGYRVAVSHGAQWVIVVDADGQYDPGEAERLLGPLVDGRGDLVLGSRRLGRAEVDDPVRYAGVLAFSALITALTGYRITDSSSGFKALTAKVASTVELTEPQYQAAELLLATVAAGFKVTEVPVTMRRRVTGRSKKAHNLAYGYHYARVIVRTWLRRR